MLDVVVTAQQPLALGLTPSASAPSQTHRNIPGSVLRGALASAWIAEHGLPTRESGRRDEFVALFERNVRFGPLFAPGSTVVPLSVMRCRYQPTEACPLVWYDEAYDEKPAPCPHCEGPVVRSRGEVEFFGGPPGQPVTRATRVALTPDGTADDGKLFTRDALAHRDATGAPRQFTGRIIGGGEWLAGERQLLLGGRRSTSGAADYVAVPTPAESLPTLPEERLVLRLLSPAVLVDETGQPSDKPDMSLLSELLGMDVELDRKWVRWDRVGGWHAAANLPKPEEHVISAGSTFELLLDRVPEPEAVQRVLDHGIGLRRAEGFGWVECRRARPLSLADPITRSATRTDTVLTPAWLSELDGDLSRWLLRELRRYQDYLARGGEPNTDLLRRAKLERLNRDQRDSISELLSAGDLVRIDSTISTLEARTRGVLP